MDLKFLIVVDCWLLFCDLMLFFSFCNNKIYIMFKISLRKIGRIGKNLIVDVWLFTVSNFCFCISENECLVV